MSLPIRSASVRTKTTDVQKTTTRVPQRNQNVRPQTQQQELERKISGTTPSANSTTSTAPLKVSVVGSQGLSSRIPSPTKSIASAPSNNQLKSALPTKTPAKGHSRQQSAVIPPLAARQNFGHARSISAVSVNSTSASSTDAPRPTRSRLSSSQPQVKPAKPRIVPTTSSSLHSTSGSAVTSNSVQHEAARNELLQLSIVHEASSQSLRALELSIMQSLTARREQLLSIKNDVYKYKQAFSAATNIAALNSWVQELGYQKACQSLQNLSVAVRDVQNLEQIFGADDGLAAAFDGWQADISGNVYESLHKRPHEPIPLQTVFEEQLAPGLHSFEQQVGLSLATLAGLTVSVPDSSLSSIIKDHTLLANSLLSHCRVMLAVGNHLVAEHLQWLDEEVASAVEELPDKYNFDKAATAPLWEM